MKKRFLFLLCIIVIIIPLITGCGGNEAAIAEDGDTVAVHYTGTLNDGSQFDSSVGGEPLEFVLGAGNMISGFEDAIRGMKVGETKTVTLSPDEAYGQHRDDLIISISRENIPEGMEIEPGQQLQLQTESGSMITATVIEITEESITLDANHRLAGKELTFEIELVKVERAE
jgi:peptidylprolyl isomerase